MRGRETQGQTIPGGSGSQALPEQRAYPMTEENKFGDCKESVYRKTMRKCVVMAEITKSERDVALALLDIWFQHRNGPNGCIYPSRETIANRARVSVKTVSRTLDMLRRIGALVVVSNTNGGRNRATQYRINDRMWCGMARRLSEKAEFLPIGESLIDYDDDFGNDEGDN